MTGLHTELGRGSEGGPRSCLLPAQNKKKEEKKRLGFYAFIFFYFFLEIAKLEEWDERERESLHRKGAVKKSKVVVKLFNFFFDRPTDNSYSVSGKSG